MGQVASFIIKVRVKKLVWKERAFEDALSYIYSYKVKQFLIRNFIVYMDII